MGVVEKTGNVVFLAGRQDSYGYLSLASFQTWRIYPHTGKNHFERCGTGMFVLLCTRQFVSVLKSCPVGPISLPLTLAFQGTGYPSTDHSPIFR